jgi:selenocysteine lyase/cysteine desulfurase
MFVALLVGSSASLPLPAPASDFFFGAANLSYFNAATLGPCAREVVANTSRDWAELEANPANEYFGMFMGAAPSFLQRNEAVRAQAAAFLGAAGGAKELALMPSTTIGLNTVAQGLVDSGFLRRGDRVLTTDQEHAGGYVQWVHYANCTPALQAMDWCSAARPVTRANATAGLLGLDLVAIPVAPAAAAPATPEAIVALFRAALDAQPRTRVVALSHVTTTHGMALPVKAIAALAHARGALVVVDGAQALGMGVDVAALGVDVYASSAHKWLLAPKGSGLLYIAAAVQPLVGALWLDGGMGVYSGFTGTRPAHTIQGLGYAIDYFARYGGPAAVGAHNLAMRARAFDLLAPVLARHAGAEVIGARSRDGPLASPILTFSVPAPWTAHTLASALYDRGIIVKEGGHNVAPNEGGPTMPPEAVRLSFHLYHGAREVEELVDAIDEVLHNGTTAALE